MRTLHTLQKTLVLRGLLVCGALVFCLGWYVWQQSTPDTRAGVSAERESIQVHLRNETPEDAYRWFIETYKGQGFDIQHNAAHLFGESLFDSVGERGMRICDAEFNYGCYHGFLTRAIAKEGLRVVTRLDSECGNTDRATVCEHGIGHGILEFLGYSKLNQALAACDMTNQSDPLAGCSAGVFMEYNVPLSESPDKTFSTQARPLVNRTQPYDVCLTVESKYRRSCFNQLPQWWHQVYSDDFSVLGTLCEHVSEPGERSACYEGIANIVGSSANYDPARTVTLCKKMPSKDGVQACLVTAAWSFALNINDRTAARTICMPLPEEVRDRCPK